MIFQLLLTACFLGIAGSVWRRGRRIRFIGTLVGSLNLIAIFFVWMPNALTALANTLGVGRGADLLLYLFFVSVTFELLMIRIRERDRMDMITHMARAIALSNAKR